jgi:SpoVK/Ycf46/Vps4 family AAA+-type ATPase
MGNSRRQKMVEDRINILLEEGEFPQDPIMGLPDSKESSHPTQWSVLPNDQFSPSFVSSHQLPPGLYEILWNSNRQELVMQKQELKLDELYELPSPEIQSILEDIQTFWERRDVYKKYNFVHKRGILLWGDPGCGKSGIIQLCVKKLIEKERGIVINIKEEEDFKYFADFIGILRKIEPERPIIVILEDLDSLASEDRFSTTKLLNILDGVKQIENVVYIATTNYPEKLQERITNRPSRFDRRYKVDMPSPEIRESYIRHKLTEKDLAAIDLPEWVKASDGMSLSHLKELVISVVVMGKSFEEALSNLVEMKEAPKIKKNSKLGFGSR